MQETYFVGGLHTTPPVSVSSLTLLAFFKVVGVRGTSVLLDCMGT